jgi:hypothetical protein
MPSQVSTLAWHQDASITSNSIICDDHWVRQVKLWALPPDKSNQGCNASPRKQSLVNRHRVMCTTPQGPLERHNTARCAAHSTQPPQTKTH